MSCHVRESPKAGSGRLASHAVIGRRDYGDGSDNDEKPEGRDDGSKLHCRAELIGSFFSLAFSLPSLLCSTSFPTVWESRPRPRPDGRPVNHEKRSKRIASRSVVESGHEFDWGMEHSPGRGLMGLMILIDESVGNFVIVFSFRFHLPLVFATAIYATQGRGHDVKAGWTHCTSSAMVRGIFQEGMQRDATGCNGTDEDPMGSWYDIHGSRIRSRQSR
ncbi:hypothetical protein EDB81DRAFT_168189 [Dactylonectria macrodidyma]|uniref:Uncharacterized protein n=1 Tax=Dactylonectria macrodidyma TaxID=307937 RepID=A0A9P9FQ16_9HYPO|nr:hypothetical protein EDB81DRAFT_168189 [Dactylonectria macrodidyma]